MSFARSVRRNEHGRLGPGFSAVLGEVFGTQGSRSKRVYVTDGGHYDNLGLLALFDAGLFSAFAIEVNREPVGYLSLVRDVHDDPPEAEVAYWVRSDRTGRGVASTAVRLAARAAFGAWPELAQVTLRCDAGNVRSIKVAERCGFTRTAEETSEPRTPAQTGIELLWTLDRKSAQQLSGLRGGL